MASKKANKAQQLSNDRAMIISDLLDKFDELIERNAGILSKDVIKLFLSKLSVESGTIATDAEKFKKLSLIDKVFDDFNNSQGAELITTFITDLDTINAENLKYYRHISDTSIKGDDIKNIINARLGLNNKGVPVKGGYIRGLMDDTSVRNKIKQEAYKHITTGTGYENTRNAISALIKGNAETMGAFKQFHRNFTYDTYVQIDRLNAALYAEKLDLKYGIFQGTRRKDSRHFCIQRKGKVFTSEEAEQWRELIGKTMTIPGKKGTKKIYIGPIVADKATYNPLVDMGGFGCVDIFSYLSEDIAFELRPDLKAKISVSDDYSQKHEGINGAKVYQHKDADKNDLSYNLKHAKILADNGESVKIRKHVEARKIKNPELELFGGKIGDFKETEVGTIRSYKGLISGTHAQGGNVPVLVVSSKLYNKNNLSRGIGSALGKEMNPGITDVWVLLNDTLIKMTRDEIITKRYASKLP